MLERQKLKGLISILCLLYCAGCAEDPANGPGFEQCRYAAPEPVFHEGLPGLSRHEFELLGKRAEEKFWVDRELKVALEQSGCDYIRQVFQFEWQGGARGNSSVYWSRTAADKFRRLAQFGAPYLSFKAISDAIRSKERQIQTGESVELQPGIQMTLNPQSAGQKQALKVVLQQTD